MLINDLQVVINTTLTALTCKTLHAIYVNFNVQQNKLIYLQSDNEVDFKVVILPSNSVIGVSSPAIFSLTGKDINTFKILH